jgi:rSAM/selenodomain-associated transferase 2
MHSMELSIIVPTFNEEKSIPALVASLAAQRDIRFELIVSDGGSTDATCDTARLLAQRNGIEIRIVTGDKGRGLQLNRGAETACGRFLLFLHADSLLEDRSALRKGIDTVSLTSVGRNRIAAGHFALRFSLSSPETPLCFYYYESKARLNRPECSHGDQGLIVSKEIFQNLGPFRTFPPMLAETRFADCVRNKGDLLLVPAEIVTSARRFESEGVYQRQVMNAILMNCANLGWDEPLLHLSELYRQHDRCGKLRLSPLLEEIHRRIAGMSQRQRSRFWHLTGSYVRGNAWQIPFFLDTRKNFARGLHPGTGPTPLLDLFDRWWDTVTDNPAGLLAAGMLTRFWFFLTRVQAKRSEKY